MMSVPVGSYPQPKVDGDNAPFVAAWHEGRLLLQYCTTCVRFIFYPRPICPHCWSDRLEWRETAGLGTIVSYCGIQRPNHAAFLGEVPILLAEIRLDENVCLLGRVIASEIRSGMKVELIRDPEATGRFPLPVFREKVSGG